MTLAEKILHQITVLPESKQAEVLDFIEFLALKTSGDHDRNWARLSLTSAMRGMEDEPTPYSRSDIKNSGHD